MKKGTLGFFLGFFVGVLGLLGLLACSDKPEKDSFMKGWIWGFVIGIVTDTAIVLFICFLPLLALFSV